MIYIFAFHYRWGSWTGVQWCPSGYLVKFLLQVEEPLPGDEDDTAANNIMFQCSDDSILIGAGGPWGTWGEWSDPCTLGICGMETKVQPAQGGDLDDTALNDVKYRCCTELEKKNEEER
ncbi:unnamed protein product [Staurois parvus]|uniref:Vitelline membrane outer layer protein 1 homolog n=1 Tax=Staurois parvus TaxID=386267 RepID=A0ABN9GA12_9NEOB|nr:unnamed protein product [Staurois parvus]